MNDSAHDCEFTSNHQVFLLVMPPSIINEPCLMLKPMKLVKFTPHVHTSPGRWSDLCTSWHARDPRTMIRSQRKSHTFCAGPQYYAE